jgi:hypothetical protein
MEQSIVYYYDLNVPLHLNAAAIIKFKYDEEIVALNRHISKLTN